MFSWSFASKKEHSPSWYIIAIIIVLMLVAYGIVKGIYLMSIVTFLFAGVYLLMENNATPTTDVVFDERGILVGSTFFDYTSFSRFSIVSMGGVPAFLRLTPSRRFAAVIDIPFSHEVDLVALRGFLSSILEEDKNNTISNADALIHAMKL